MNELFREIIKGLSLQGWREQGGSETFCLMERGRDSIKIYCDGKCSQDAVVTARYSVYGSRFSTKK